MNDMESIVDSISSNISKIARLSHAVSTLPTSDIIERRYERICAGLSPDFKVHLHRDAYPDAYEFGLDRVMGCDIVWH